MTTQQNKLQQILSRDSNQISNDQNDPLFGISIMTDPDLHPLPITPNDPLSIFLNNSGQQSAQSVTGKTKSGTQLDSIFEDDEDFGQNSLPKNQVSNYDDHVDIEISNTDANPNSMFQTALPSLKLNSENKLSDEQMNMIQQQRNQIQENLRKQGSGEKPNNSPQGQGAVSKLAEARAVIDLQQRNPAALIDGTHQLELKMQKQSSTNSQSKVLSQIPDSCKQEIVQSNLANLKLQNMMSSNQLSLNKQISNFSVGTIAAKPIYSRFFILKSYTEEDVHKAIKYQLWSSTDRGNKILDDAFIDIQNLKTSRNSELDLESQQAIAEAHVYLLYSVNKSKHFCGVAKMIERVNLKQDHADLWKQPGKWPGSLKIEWIYIKDIPNTQFIHIENPLNENKPACQGRDCQEVYPKTGERMMAIFQSFRSTTRLYDDFKYYDDQERFRQQRHTQKEKFSFRNDKPQHEKPQFQKPQFEKSHFDQPHQFQQMGQKPNNQQNDRNLGHGQFKYDVMRSSENQQFQKKDANLERFFSSELEAKAVQNEELPFKRYQDYFGEQRAGTGKYQQGNRPNERQPPSGRLPFGPQVPRYGNNFQKYDGQGQRQWKQRDTQPAPPLFKQNLHGQDQATNHLKKPRADAQRQYHIPNKQFKEDSHVKQEINVWNKK